MHSLNRLTPAPHQNGYIWDIKRYALHDGPGIRTTVFFKGCPLACLWCCNPESQDFIPELTRIDERCLLCGLCLKVCPNNAIEIIDRKYWQIKTDQCDCCGLCADKCPGEALVVMGKKTSVDQVLTEITKDAVFFSRSGGGLTLSGGEPLAQADFAAEILRRYKKEEHGPHAAVETSGFIPWKNIEKVLPFTDLFLYDLKHMDPQTHYRLTGANNELIKKNLGKLDETGKKIIIRLPLIPDLNNNPENIKQTCQFVQQFENINQIDLLPYHRLGEPKYTRLNRKYDLAGKPACQEELVQNAGRIIEDFGFSFRVGG